MPLRATRRLMLHLTPARVICRRHWPRATLCRLFGSMSSAASTRTPRWQTGSPAGRAPTSALTSVRCTPWRPSPAALLASRGGDWSRTKEGVKKAMFLSLQAISLQHWRPLQTKNTLPLVFQPPTSPLTMA